MDNKDDQEVRSNRSLRLREQSDEGARMATLRSTRQGRPAALPQGFGGGTPELWDRAYDRDPDGDPACCGLGSAPERAIFNSLLKCTRPLPGETLVELGCGGSRWLPLLAMHADVRVAGVDFSMKGVELARRLLQSARADDSGIVHQRIDDYVPRHAGKFDIAVSFGLIEHFEDLEEIIRCHVNCVRPGGRIYMSAPNLSGPNLSWARFVAPDLFDWHQPISARMVAQACLRQGCTHVASNYLAGPRLFANPSAACLGTRWMRRSAVVGRRVLNGAGELSHRLAPTISTKMAGGLLSPYFAVSARVPQ
jgi:2-polyprenyl-3-methyl-5-hydroxy-6-metoxy-1,4-benzoquinol methylase